MIRTIIIDDEEHCSDRLARLLQEDFRQTIDLAGTFISVEDAIKGIKNLRPELVFLDVQLQGQTGFDLLQKLDKIDFKIVFVTAFNKYAVQAFKFSAIDYLLKPVDSEDLRLAIGKVTERISHDGIRHKFDALLYNLKNMQVESKRICIPEGNSLMVLQVGDIIRCESSRNYTNVYLKDKTKLLVAKTLKEFEDLLEGCNFFRVHHSHLINMAYAKKYTRGSGGSVFMMDNTEIGISTRKKESFLEKLLEMNRG